MGVLTGSTSARAWRGQLAELTSFAESPAFDVASLATAASDLLARFSGVPATVYRPVRIEDHFAISFWGRTGIDEAFVSDFSDLLARHRNEGLFFFDPTRPAASERNVVRIIPPVENVTFSAAAGVFAKHGLGSVAQTRMLVCSGPMLLGWVGVFREEVGHRSKRDARRDISLVQSLGRALLRPMRLIHGLSGQLLLEGVLEALKQDAYLVAPSGRIETANDRGIARLATALRGDRTALREAIAAHLDGREDPVFEVHPLRTSKEVFLVQRRPSPDASGLALRLEEARLRWSLSAQQLAVLRHLAAGDANKDIARKLEISVRTVETHVNTLIAKAGVDSRLRLVARLWLPGASP